MRCCIEWAWRQLGTNRWRCFTAIPGSSHLDREPVDPHLALETSSQEVLLFLGCSSYLRWQDSLEWCCPPQKGRRPGLPRLSIRQSTKKVKHSQFSFMKSCILLWDYVCRVESCLLPPRRTFHLRLRSQERGFDPLGSTPSGECWSRRWLMCSMAVFSIQYSILQMVFSIANMFCDSIQYCKYVL